MIFGESFGINVALLLSEIWLLNALFSSFRIFKNLTAEIIMIFIYYYYYVLHHPVPRRRLLLRAGRQQEG